MRMCGKHTVTGCIPMCLYTKKSVWEDIRKGYWLQEDIIKSAGMADPGLMYPTWMEQIAMEKGKLPKRKLAQRSSDKVKVAKTGEGVGMSLADFTAKVVAPPIVSGEEETDTPPPDLEKGYLIPIPPVNSALHRVYNNIVDRVKRDNRIWISRSEMRNDNTVSNSARFTELQGSIKLEVSKGLVWRKLEGNNYEYAFL